MALTDAVSFSYKVPTRTAAYVEKIQTLAEKSLVLEFAKYYKANMIDQVAKSNQCDEEVKTRLVGLLQAASKRVDNRGNSGGFLGGLFGKH